MKAPFPWFGGKRSVAQIIWQRFGNVPNYVEPFFGSGAVLLARPHEPKIETVNDADHFLANFWRAVRFDPHAVAKHADWPVNETDLHARHYWLVTDGRERLAGIVGDPNAYDVQVAGWWLWGICSWIGNGWCSEPGGPWQWQDGAWRQRPHLGDAGQGINHQRPHLGDAGQGINRQPPHLGNAGRGDAIQEYMIALSNRLRDVRVCCGDWSRVMGETPTIKNGLTGVFLDPPYADTAERSEVYAVDCMSVAHDVREWAIANGGNPLLRICLAGYDGEHEMPDNWQVVAWKARGGYGSQGENTRGRENAHKERLWFSPHCIVPERTPSLFDLLEAAE